MKQKYSRRVIFAAAEFMRSVNDEFEGGLESEQVDAMFDAFDPALKKQLFMEMLMGNVGSKIGITRVNSNDPVQKIQAIKEVRGLTGLGLKEAKDLVEASDYKVMMIEGTFDAQSVSKFSAALLPTGYKVV